MHRAAPSGALPSNLEGETMVTGEHAAGGRCAKPFALSSNEAYRP